jgi:hypothetical protein
MLADQLVLLAPTTDACLFRMRSRGGRINGHLRS